MQRMLWRIVGLLVLLPITAQPALAAVDAKQSFNRVWERNDKPVAAGRADRSWTWGPGPNTAPMPEAYVDAQLPESSRMVQYFDKGRMEINNPAGDPNHPWYVTSGLLPRELMTGAMQTGTNDFAPRRDSYISAIGDPGSFPAYPDLLPLYENPGTIEPSEIGRPATDLLNQDLRITRFTAYEADPATIIVRGANNHGVPQAFIDFQNQQGPVYENAGYVRRNVFDPLFVFGLPITPAVWVNTRVGGTEQPVLFQVFERRVLTYNPANQRAFRVEMGNVGQHYYQWRYHREQVSEWGAWNWNTHEVRPKANSAAIYSLEVEWTETPSGAPAGSGPPPKRGATYRLYYAPHTDAPRELRHTGYIGGCYTVNVALLPPATPDSAVSRIGLALQCVDSPSAGRGVGVTIKSSYDGGRTFIERYRM